MRNTLKTLTVTAVSGVLLIGSAGMASADPLDSGEDNEGLLGGLL